jgi:hypothetical protein
MIDPMKRAGERAAADRVIEIVPGAADLAASLARLRQSGHVLLAIRFRDDGVTVIEMLPPNSSRQSP